MKEHEIIEEVAATLATLQTLREILKDEYLEKDRNLLCDVWCGTIAFAISKGCNKGIAAILMDFGKSGPLRHESFKVDELRYIIERLIKDINDIPKNVARAELIRSMATGEPLFTVDLTKNT